MVTVGEILQREREKKGLTLKDVEKKIRVREKFLQAVEENRWDSFSSRIYISGIIKNYAAVLGLEPDKMLAIFRREYARKEELTFKGRISKRSFTPETRKYLIIIIVSLFLLFSVYFGYELTAFLSPPKIMIILPKQSTFKNVEKIHIVGETEKEASITIFGERVYQNKNGIFFYDFPLNPGKNQLIIEVVGANGKKTVFKKEYFLTP